MASESTSLKRGLPLWANLLMLLVIATVVAIGSSVFGVFMTMRQITIDATIPERILANARKIAVFPEPLPAGYKYLGAGELGYITLLLIEHESDHQQIAFCSLQIKMPPDVDSKSLLNSAYDVGINTVYTSAKFQELKGHGTETIAGEQMPYLIGQYLDQAGRKADGMVGCICLNKAAKNILIYSYPDPPSAYNQQVTIDLLRSIKGF